MSDDEIDRMDVARHLLPPPGDAVAGQLIAEVRRLRLTEAERNAVEQAVKDYEDSAATFCERSMDAAAANGMKQSLILSGLLDRLA